MAEVIAYVDGWNLYHGMRAKYGRAYFWLDLERLVSLLRADDELIAVRYFTAVAKGEPDAARNQETYLAALAQHCRKVEIVRGRFKPRTFRCHACGQRWTCGCTPPAEFQTYEEKLTDVALGVSMVEDAARGHGSLSVLISSDTDFHPAVDACLRLGRRVMLACPPGKLPQRDRFAGAVTSFHIPEEHLTAAQLPETVRGPAGRTYERPAKWH